MCKYGPCKFYKNGKCTKEKEIKKMPMEELAKALVTNVCTLRK